MRRHILGVLAASIAAPYLFALLWIALNFIFGDRLIMKEPADLFKAIPMGTFGLIILGIPLLIFVSLCARVVNAIEQPTWRAPVLGGMTIGLGFTIAFLMGSFAYDSIVIAFLVSGIGSGAICGWIYWRIALRHQHSVSRSDQSAGA